VMATFAAPRVEDGTPEASLENAERLVKVHGLPDKIRLRVRGPSDSDYIVDAWWKRNRHEFLGFSWGYRGKGPAALEKFFALLQLPVAMNVIVKFRPEDMRYNAELDMTYPFEFRRGVHYF